MNRKLLAAAAISLVLAVLAAGGVAGAVKSTTGNLEAEFDSGFSPRALPKEPTGIAFSFWSEFQTLDGTRVPPLRKLQVRNDRHIEFDPEGIPVCQLPGSRDRLTLGGIRKACRTAIVGTGRIEVGIPFPGDMTIAEESDLLAVNGGFESGAGTFHAYAELTIPTRALIAVPIEVKRIRKGRFRSESIATFPKISGGEGVISFFKLDLKQRLLRATCPDRRLDTRFLAVFPEDVRASAYVSKRCAARD